MVEKTLKNLQTVETKEKKAVGCYLVFWFLIIALLGMLLVLFIKVKFFPNETQVW